MSRWSLLALSCTAALASGRPQCADQDVLPNPSNAGDWFGESASMEGDLAAIGAPCYVGCATTSAVYVFRRVQGSWTQEARLVGTGAGSGSSFGCCVALSGTTIAVGARSHASGATASGAVYVFEYDLGVWGETQVLAPANPFQGQNFGHELALDGDTLFVAGDHQPGSLAGAVRVFERSAGTWTETQLLLAPLPGNGFGTRLAIDGDTAMIGSGGGTGGRTFVYRREASGWTSIQALSAQQAIAGAGFGQAIALDGNRAVIGAPNYTVAGLRAGTAHLFERAGSWSEVLRFEPQTPRVNDRFGFAVGVAGDRIWIGVPGEDDAGADAGALLLFEPTGPHGWVRTAEFFAGAPPSPQFGFAVAASGARVLAGAPDAEGAGGFVYPVGGATFLDCSNPGLGARYCDPARPNSSGVTGVITATGSAVVQDDDLTLTAIALPPSQFGYFLAGQTQGFFNPPGSQGIICLSGNIGRYNQVANIIQGPSGSIQLDLTAIPVNPPQAVVPGDTWNFQCWYRDNNPTLTSNFTDAVSVTFQ